MVIRWILLWRRWKRIVVLIELRPAQRARPVRRQPPVNALDVVHVPARRQQHRTISPLSCTTPRHTAHCALARCRAPVLIICLPASVGESRQGLDSERMSDGHRRVRRRALSSAEPVRALLQQQQRAIAAMTTKKMDCKCVLLRKHAYQLSSHSSHEN